MSDFIIDAPLLACPNYTHFSKDDFQIAFIDYLSRLADLVKLRSEIKSIKFWRDSTLAEVLHEQGCYPFLYSLSNAFQYLYNPKQFQLQDVNVLATMLIEKSLRLEALGEVKEVVVSSCSLIGDPVVGRSDLFLSHICGALAKAIVILGDGEAFYPNTYLTSGGESSACNVVQANFTIDLRLLDSGIIEENLPPSSLSITNFQDALSLFNGADLCKWWSMSTEEAIVDVLAIKGCLGKADPWEEIKRIRRVLSVGADFISSGKQLGFMHEETKISRILRVCIDLVENRNLSDSHWLRTGKGANEPQKTRGDWCAWRHDVDREFHLHYWRSGDQIELANIVVHEDFDITK